MCRLGATWNGCKAWWKPSEWWNTIQTAYGDSVARQNFKDWNALIAGIGQGNRARPQIWAAVSTPLFNIMWADVFAIIICTISWKGLQLSGFAFVDDTNLCITIQPTEQTMIHAKIQLAVNHWAGLLRALGEHWCQRNAFGTKKFKWQKISGNIRKWIKTKQHW